MKKWIVSILFLFSAGYGECNHLSILNADNLTRGTLPNERLDESSVTLLGQLNDRSKTIVVSTVQANLIHLSTVSFNNQTYSMPTNLGGVGQVLSISNNNTFGFVDQFAASTSTFKKKLEITVISSSQVLVTAEAIDIMGHYKTNVSTVCDTSKVGAGGADVSQSPAVTKNLGIFLLSDSLNSKTGVLFSVSESPTIPSGYTKWRKVGTALFEGGTGFIHFYKRDNLVTFSTTIVLYTTSDLTSGPTSVEFGQIVSTNTVMINVGIILHGDGTTGQALSTVKAQGLNNNESAFYIGTNANDANNIATENMWIPVFRRGFYLLVSEISRVATFTINLIGYMEEDL